MIEQRGKTCDEYVQEFKKVARGSSYEGRPLIEESKRGLSGAIRRKLAKAEEPPSTIGEWQERAVRLNRNQRQSRGCWGEMRHAQGEMHSQEGVIWRKRRAYNAEMGRQRRRI